MFCFVFCCWWVFFSNYLLYIFAKNAFIYFYFFVVNKVLDDACNISKM